MHSDALPILSISPSTTATTPFASPWPASVSKTSWAARIRSRLSRSALRSRVPILGGHGFENVHAQSRVTVLSGEVQRGPVDEVRLTFRAIASPRLPLGAIGSLSFQRSMPFAMLVDVPKDAHGAVVLRSLHQQQVQRLRRADVRSTLLAVPGFCKAIHCVQVPKAEIQSQRPKVFSFLLLLQLQLQSRVCCSRR
eukprot:scaffold703_cov245-Pinguiococcus_pyrenoidosus.AAC.6